MAILLPVQRILGEKLNDFNKRLHDSCIQVDGEGTDIVITDASQELL